MQFLLPKTIRCGFRRSFTPYLRLDAEIGSYEFPPVNTILDESPDINKRGNPEFARIKFSASSYFEMNAMSNNCDIVARW